MTREEQGDLFGTADVTPAANATPVWPLREQLKARATELAKKGIFLGTSSWKYEGWLGQLYAPERYRTRGRHSKARFEESCLAEYAEVLKAVGVDASYYTFPRAQNLQALGDQVPDDFRFGFKVTDAITLKHFPNVAKSGARAGQRNPDFLNADLFATAFVKPCEAIRSKVGVLIFEFSRFSSSDYEHVGAFLPDLDAFLSKLLPGWPYAIELRNKHWLTPEYFACLARHRVTHVFNSWEAMPSVSEQMTLPGSLTTPAMIAARFLLKPGRKYEDAVKSFSPYKETKEVNAEARAAIAALIKVALAATGGNLVRALIFINNRLEGNALNTIAEVLLASDDWK